VAALYEKKEIIGACNEFDMGQKHNGTTMRKKQGKTGHAHSLPSQNSSSVARESMCPTISSQP
jgi:hypothetical protein